MILQFGRLELVFGGLLMAIGGFQFRFSNDYGFILVGLLLIGLGILRLWEFAPTQSDSTLPDDRLLFRLRSDLSSDCTVCVNYPVRDDGVADYILLGPPGVFVLHRYEHRGYLDGSSHQEEWEQYPFDYPEREDDDEAPNPTSVPNRLPDLRERVRHLQNRLDELGEPPEPIPEVRGYLVVTYLRAQGPLFEIDDVVGLDEVTERFEDQPDRLSVDGIKYLERQLNVENYSPAETDREELEEFSVVPLQ